MNVLHLVVDRLEVRDIAVSAADVGRVEFASAEAAPEWWDMVDLDTVRELRLHAYVTGERCPVTAVVGWPGKVWCLLAHGSCHSTLALP